MKQFRAFVIKEFYHVLRDKRSLLLLIGLPIVQIFLFGFALSNEVKNATIMIVDQSKDAASLSISEKIRNNDNFHFVGFGYAYKDAHTAFMRGEIQAAVIIPPNFQKSILRRENPTIQIIGDATDPNTATAVINYVTVITMNFQRQALGMTSPVSIDIRNHMLYNPELKGVTNFVPGLMALVLMLIGVLMTSVSIVKEKEMGTMEILLVSPFHPLAAIIAKAVPYLLVSIFNLCMILLISIHILGMPMEGSYFLLFSMSVLLIITALSMGLFISNQTSSQQVAMLISLMGMLLPTMLFTGFMFPIENMPIPLQIISNFAASKWYYIIVKNIMIKGLGVAYFWKEALVLVGMTIFFIVMSLRRFKMRLA